VSVIAIGGRRYACGLYWLGRGGARATARTARRLGRPWCVHHGERTGFAAADTGAADTGAADTRAADTRAAGAAGSPEGLDPAGLGPEGLHSESFDPEGLGALALALLEHVEGAFWMALVDGEAADGRDRYALVKARDGAVLADGDEAFDDRAAAVAAFERARTLGWALFATPGLLEELGGSGIAPIDPAALGETASRLGAAIALRSAAPSVRRRRAPVAAAIGVAALAAAVAVWLQRDVLLSWLESPAPVSAPVASSEPTFAVSVDGAALIAACRQALIDNPPFLPGWRIERIECAARFADVELSGVRPELAGRPVLLARWRLASGHAEAVQRRVAERHLGGWHAAMVADGRAWALAPMAPVLRTTEVAPPALLELRRAVDRSLGTAGARIGYARGADGGWSVRIDEPGPLPRLVGLVGGIGGLELTALSRGEAGGWRLAGRPAMPVTLAASQLRALGVAVDEAPGRGKGSGERPDGAAGSGEGPAGGHQAETDHGT